MEARSNIVRFNMNNNTEFFNAYVENLLAENNELNKIRVMMKTQINILESISKNQAERIKELEESLDKLSNLASEEETESF